jgi:hypothetical protein
MTIEGIGQLVNKALTSKGYEPVRIVIETNDSAATDVRVTKDGSSILLHLYPAIVKKTSYEAVKVALSELGDYVLKTAEPIHKKMWDDRLVAATPDQVNRFQGHLSSGKFMRFAEIVKATVTATDRLVAIHLANGLLAQGQSLVSAQNIEVVHWGTTSEFATGKRLYSLIPLLSVYAPADVYQHFGSAFADSVMNNLSSVIEKSTQTAYLSLVTKVAQKIRKTKHENP